MGIVRKAATAAAVSGAATLATAFVVKLSKTHKADF